MIHSVMQYINANLGGIIVEIIILAGAIIVFTIKTTSKAVLDSKYGKGWKKQVIKKAEEMALYTVKMTQETIMKDSKEALKDGRITMDEFKSICFNAKDTALRSLYEEMKEPLKDLFDGSIKEIRNFLSDLIEKKVEELKK